MKTYVWMIAVAMLALGCDSTGGILVIDDDDVSGDDDDATAADTDADEDGFTEDEDCDDNDPDAYPGAEEEPYDGVDQDCDGSDLTDVDGDGYDGGPDGDDCDDDNPDVHPGAEEICDGHDNDCDGDPSAGEVDEDGDGHLFCGGDCDDQDAMVNPSAPDYPGDGQDQNCDGGDTTPLGSSCGGDTNRASIPEVLDEFSIYWNDAETDGHYYDDIEFNALAGWTVYLSYSGDGFAPYILLLDPDCETLDEAGANGGSSVVLEIEIPADGTYTAVVTTEQAWETGYYTLQLEADAVPPGLGTTCEDDEHVIAAGMHQLSWTDSVFELGGSDAMDGPGGPDRYYDDMEFVVRAGDEIDVIMWADQVDGYLYLLDEDCDVVAEDDNGYVGMSPRITYTADYDGVYTAVFTSANPGETGSFYWYLDWP